MFVDKSSTFFDVVYLKYFIDLTEIHEYKLRGRMFGILVLQTGRGLSLKYKAIDRKLHAAYSSLVILVCS